MDKNAEDPLKLLGFKQGGNVDPLQNLGFTPRQDYRTGGLVTRQSFATGGTVTATAQQRVVMAYASNYFPNTTQDADGNWHKPSADYERFRINGIWFLGKPTTSSGKFGYMLNSRIVNDVDPNQADNIFVWKATKAAEEKAAAEKAAQAARVAEAARVAAAAVEANRLAAIETERVAAAAREANRVAALKAEADAKAAAAAAAAAARQTTPVGTINQETPADSTTQAEYQAEVNQQQGTGTSDMAAQDQLNKANVLKPAVVANDPAIQTTATQQIAAREDITAPDEVVVAPITAQTGVATTATQQTPITASTMTAATAGTLGTTEAAQGTVTQGAATAAGPEFTDANKVATAQRDTTQEAAAQAQAQDFTMDTKSMVDSVTGQTVTVATTPEAEQKQREAITGVPANTGEAAQIINTVGYEASKQRTVTGVAATGGAVSMVAEVGGLPTSISAAIVEDPATVTAQIDNQPVEVQAAIAALPTSALVSSQMETLLAGIEEGRTPIWARPAVSAIVDSMAARGLDTSTVARDSLFNAIIQSAMPIAQSNAQALQQRAAQNLSNEQQANLAQATQSMQLRLSNLSNQQTSASQTAQMAQQMNVMQSQFTQDSGMLSAQQMQVQIKLQRIKKEF